MALYTADRRYFLTADRSRAVEESDSEAAFLLISTGQTMPEEDARRYGLIKTEKAKAAEPAADKAAPAPANKAMPAPRNKRGGK